MELFDREIRLTVEREGIVSEFVDYRVTFEITKYNSPVDNRATIRIYNLGRDLRRALSQRLEDRQAGPFATVFLSAGYRGRIGLIFRGVVAQALNRREGADWVTELLAFTSLAQTANATLGPEFSYKDATTPKVMIDKIFQKLAWGLPRYSGKALEKLSKAQPITGSFTGMAAQEVTQLLEGYGLSWSIDDDMPRIFQSNAAFNDLEDELALTVFSEATGLIGTPEVTEYGATARVLLTPSLQVGSRIMLESPTIAEAVNTARQEYTLIQLRHIGDTHGNEWFSELEGNYPPTISTTEPAQQPIPFVRV